MNSREGRGIMIALGLAIAILISACGTLQIDTEPVVAEDEIAGSATELTQDVMEEVTGDVTDDGTAMPEEASTEVATVEDVIESPNKASEITDLDDTWNQFTDHRLGFSIEFPKEMVTFRGSCTWNEEESSFRPELAPVPVQIFEDTDAVYIAAEQYYELAGERRDGGRAYYDECNLVTNSLELLQDPDGFKEPYWELVVKDIHSDAELDSFIKERYGAGCSAGEQVSSTQDGVYDVKIQGDGKDLAESQCPMNYVTVVKYYPEGNKVVAWDRGQANSFVADVSYQVVYDQEMEDSFRFLTDGSPETEDEEGPETAEQSNGGAAEEAGDETAAAAANYDYSDWLPYANETLGYSLMYPAQADIIATASFSGRRPGSMYSSGWPTATFPIRPRPRKRPSAICQPCIYA